MKLLNKYMANLFNFSPKSNHLHPLQVENCDSNSRLVVDEDDNGKVRLERVDTKVKVTLNLSLLSCMLFANYSHNFHPIVIKFGKHYFLV